jgi:hypothetical protein
MTILRNGVSCLVEILRHPIEKKVKRVIKAPPSVKQIEARQKLAAVGNFFFLFKEAIDIGLKVIRKGKMPRDVAYRFNYQHFSGVYPDLIIDYPRLVFSRGPLQNVHSPTVELVETGLLFNWLNWSGGGLGACTDHIVLIVYFPNLQIVKLLRGALTRMSETAFMSMEKSRTQERMEMYVFLKSAYNRNVSNSLYLGSLNHP